MIPPLPATVAGQVLALGTDLLDARRILHLLDRFGARFIQRCYAPTEQALAQKYRDPGPFYARQFAAKEAVAKALGTGIGAQARLTEIITTRTALGQPVVRVEGAARATLLRLGGSATPPRVLISLSDEGSLVLAVALIVRA